jgi:hypothetical protein
MDIIITVLDIINLSVVYTKYDVSEAGFCLLLQVETTQIGLVDRT